MKRWIPGVRALCERVRRPARTMLVTLVVVAPLSGLALLEGPGSRSADRAAATAAVAVGREMERTDPAVAAAWRRHALAREREPVAERFAKEFGIPLALAKEIHSAAVAERVAPRVAFGLVRTESSFRRTAVSYAGAIGYTQLLPSTARWLVPGTSRSDLFETRTNLRIGFRYLNHLVDKYDGNVRLALTAYNRGPGTVDRLLRQGRNPDNGYAGKVLA